MMYRIKQKMKNLTGSHSTSEALAFFKNARASDVLCDPVKFFIFLLNTIHHDMFCSNEACFLITKNANF